ncbi:hypothetical protein Y032_1138g3673 [Ancylostoma ceylanicum]|uniref:Uncharacterized protein n=1 Tax=Ancylostoma ceylanicum TaxID=53326 RepID=A0A016W786_9BILA|nr:hypothetical protein Y032_1138g3673 [Ancylostoma ceylanicum]
MKRNEVEPLLTALKDSSYNFTIMKGSDMKLYCWPLRKSLLWFDLERPIWTYEGSNNTTKIDGDYSATVTAVEDGVISCVVQQTFPQKPLCRVIYHIRTVLEKQVLAPPMEPKSLKASVSSNMSRVVNLTWEMKWKEKTPSSRIIVYLKFFYESGDTVYIGNYDWFDLPPDTTQFSFFMKRAKCAVEIVVSAFLSEGFETKSAPHRVEFNFQEEFALSPVQSEIVANGSGVELHWTTTGDKENEISEYLAIMTISHNGTKTSVEKTALSSTNAMLPAIYSGKYNFAIVAMYNDYAIDTKVFKEMEMEVTVPTPTKVHLTFEHPKLAYVHFQSPMTEWVLDEYKGCEVYICRSANITAECKSKRISHRERIGSFTEMGSNEYYYTTVTCFSIERYGPQTSWIVFKTPTNWKVGVPKEEKVHNSGVEMKLYVDEGFNVDLSWSFYFVNKTQLEKQHVRSVDVSVHRKVTYPE